MGDISYAVPQAEKPPPPTDWRPCSLFWLAAKYISGDQMAPKYFDECWPLLIRIRGFMMNFTTAQPMCKLTGIIVSAPVLFPDVFCVYYSSEIGHNFHRRDPRWYFFMQHNRCQVVNNFDQSSGGKMGQHGRISLEQVVTPSEMNGAAANL